MRTSTGFKDSACDAWLQDLNKASTEVETQNDAIPLLGKASKACKSAERNRIHTACIADAAPLAVFALVAVGTTAVLRIASNCYSAMNKVKRSHKLSFEDQNDKPPRSISLRSMWRVNVGKAIAVPGPCHTDLGSVVREQLHSDSRVSTSLTSSNAQHVSDQS